MDLDKAIKNRRSVRKFSLDKPDWRDVIECVDFLRYAPMAGKNFSLRAIISKDQNKIQRAAEAAQQDFIAKAHYIVILYSMPSRTKINFGEKSEIYLRQQAGAAIQNFLLKVEEKGLATCWIGDFVEDQIKNAFVIPENMQVEAIFPIGYEFKKSRPTKKVDLDRMLFFEKHDNKKMKLPRKITT